MDFLNPGEKIKMIRERLGLKQSDLEVSGVSRSYISKIETGKRPLTESTAKVLAETINHLAVEKNIGFTIEYGYLMETAEESLYKYCMEKVGNVKSIDEIDEILHYAVKYSLTEVILKCHITRGNLYFNGGNNTKAISCYNEALQLAYMESMEDRYVTIWNNISSCYIRTADYKNAAVYLAKAFEVCRLKEDSDQRNIVTYNLALCYCEMGKYEKAIEIIDECTRLDHDMVIDKLRFAILLTKGGALIECGRYEEAEMLFTRIMENIKEDKKSKAFCLHNLGTIYNKLGKYEDAEKSYIEAIEIRKAINLSKASATMIELGEMYVSIGRKDEGMERLKEGIEYANSHGRYKDIIRGSAIMEQSYRNSNEIDKLEMLYIKLLDMLVGNIKMIDYRNEILSKIGLLYIERNHLDEYGK